MKKIKLFGEIGWDIMAHEIEDQLLEANGEDIEITLKTPGGFVSEGALIDEALLSYKQNFPKAQIIVDVIEAQSYGSYLLANPAIDMRTARHNSIGMIHNPLMGVIGDYQEMKKAADLLERRAALFAERYSNIMKKHTSEIRQMMNDETYFIGGQELKDAGLVDEIVDEKEKLKDKQSLRAMAETRMDVLKLKIKNTKEDFEKIAAITKNYNNIVDKNIMSHYNEHANKPAMSGENNIQEQEMSIKTIDDLQNELPEIHAEAIKAGKIQGINEEKGRVKSLLEMKNKKDFEGIEMIQNRIDEAVANGETIEDVKLAIHAMSLKGEVQAAIDTNEIGDINTPDDGTVSGEKMKEVDNRRVF